MRPLIAALILVCVACQGCSFVSFVGLLKGMADNEKQIQSYLKRQESRFARLKKDLASGRLREGLSYKSVIARYGEPVLRELSPAGEGTLWIYRHPGEFISTDLIHLYFGPEGRLSRWEFNPAS